MANWLESIPCEKESTVSLVGKDDISYDPVFWVDDMFSAPPTRQMPRPAVPAAPVTPFQRPSAGNFTRVSRDQISFHSKLEPDMCRQAMRRMRALRPQRALVCSIETAGHLSVKDFYSSKRISLILDESVSRLLNEVLESEQPVVRHDANWTVCAPLRDRRGAVAGLLLVEGTAARISPQELGKLVRWAANETTPEAEVPAPRYRPGGCAGLESRELATFLRSLSTMVAAGVPLQRSLLQMAGPAASPGLRELCSCMSYDLSNGYSFSRAASRHPKVFGSVHVGLLRVGENTGQIDRILGRLATYEEKRVSSVMKMRSALTYPAMLIAFCLVAAILAPPFLFEGHFQLIRELGVQAPWLTRCLMAFSTAMRTPWPYLVVAAVLPLSFFAGRRWLQKSDNQLGLTQLLLKLPKVGPLVRTLLQTRFARALSIQVESGANIVDAIQLSGQSCGNPLMVLHCEEICKQIYKGKGLAASMASTGFFTPLFVAVMQTAEEVGEIGKLSSWLADSGDEDLERCLETVTSLVEPLVMFGMGGMVGLMVLATMLPLSSALDAF